MFFPIYIFNTKNFLLILKICLVNTLITLLKMIGKSQKKSFYLISFKDLLLN